MKATVVINHEKSQLPKFKPDDHTADGESRIHYLDNLRAIAMLLGVYLHGVFAYATPSNSIWLVTDPKSSVTIDATIWFIHLFRMPIFFLLAGYFAKLVIQKRGVMSFLRGRLIRVVLPFVLFFPLLVIAYTVIIVFSISYIDNPLGLLGVIRDSVETSADAPQRSSYNLMHLWFLYYLFFFAIANVLLINVSVTRFDWPITAPSLLFAFPIILVPGVFMAGIPLPAPESFKPIMWPFLFYGGFYWLGWKLRGHEQCIEAMSRYWGPLLIGCLLLFAIYYLFMPTLDLSSIANTNSSRSNLVHWVGVILTSYLSVWLTFIAMIFGRRFLDCKDNFLSFMADASYWIYLIHLPIVLLLQTLLISTEFHVFIKAFIVVFVTALFCTATYTVFVRYSPIGWMLHGKRSFP